MVNVVNEVVKVADEIGQMKRKSPSAPSLFV
jgi:hypothetical protein